MDGYIFCLYQFVCSPLTNLFFNSPEVSYKRSLSLTVMTTSRVKALVECKYMLPRLI